jgi:hypothetical protein
VRGRLLGSRGGIFLDADAKGRGLWRMKGWDGLGWI